MNEDTESRAAPQPLTRLHSSATTHGPAFEFRLAALLALRARRRGLRFRLYSNVAAARPMDDLVLRVDAPVPVTYFVQLKHARRGGAVGAKAFLSKNSLSTYYDWFCEYQNMYNQRYTDSDPDKRLLTSWRMEVRLVLYTNKKVEHAPPRSTATQQNLDFPWESLLTTGEEDNAFSVQYDETWNMLQEDTFRNDFLPRLKVLGGQAHVNKLEEIIRKELDSMYGKPLKLSQKYAKEYVEEFRKWAEESSVGGCITEASQIMEKIIAEDLRASAREAAQRTGLAFQERQCPSAGADCPFRARSCLGHAVARSAAALLRVPGVAAGLRAARAQQLLDRDFPGRWAYVDERSLKDFPTAALAAACSVCDVVVLDVNKATKPLKELFDTVCTGERKCVLVTDSDVVKKYLLGRGPFTEMVDEWTLDQLTDEAQDTFMDALLEFQGETVALRELEQAWPSVRRDVDGALLGRLAQGDAAVGAAPSWADADALHHLPRTLAHGSRLSWAVLRLPSRADHLVLHGFSREDVVRQNVEIAQEKQKKGDNMPSIMRMLDDRFTVLDEAVTESTLMEQFEQLCATKALRNVHLLEKMSGSLLWRASRGNTAAVAEFMQPLTPQCTPEPLCSHRPSAERERVFESGRVQLLLGEPGIGKSSFLQRLAADARAQTPPRWAVVIKLLDHDGLLDEMPAAEDMAAKDVVDLVAAAAGVAAVDCKAARRSVEAALLHSGAIHVFVDGVDEVVPALEAKALRLLELLMETKAARIWVASRPEVGDRLRRTLGCATWQLQPLSRGDQETYLKKCWTAEDDSNSEAVREVAGKMVEAFARIPGRQSQFQLVTPVALQHLLRTIIHELHNALKTESEEPLLIGEINNLVDEITETFSDVCSVLIADKMLDVNYLTKETLRLLIKKLERNSKQKNIFVIINSKQEKIVVNILQSFEEEVFRWSMLAIPLHLRMAAEAYAEKIREAVRLGENVITSTISQLQLFAHFVNKKRQQCEQRYGTVRPAMRDQGDGNIFHDVHQYYAISMFSAVLPEESRRKFQLNKSEDYQKYITKDKTDILCQTETGRPQFTHYSFMEYFAAAWMFKKYQSFKNATKGGNTADTLKLFLNAALQRKAVSSVHFFFDLMLADESLLYTTVLADDEAALRTCLASGERADRVDQAGRSALHLAASYGRAGAVLALLDSGATLELRDRLHDWTPLEYADAALELEAAEQLLRRGGDTGQLVNTVRAANHALISKAAQLDLVEIMRKLLLSRLWQEVISGFNVYKVVIKNDPTKYNEEHSNISSISTDSTKEVTTRSYVQAPLHTASAFGSTEVIRLLVTVGADVNIRTERQRTALHLAASQGHKEIAWLLLKAGAEKDAQDDINNTPLHLAACNGHQGVVRLLLSNQAAVNHKTSTGGTALHNAAFQGHTHVAEILLENGADVHSCTNDNLTPLQVAVQGGNRDVAELLLNNNAKVNRSDVDGDTPLHIAAARNQTSVAEVLIRHGAQVNSCNIRKLTPLHAAAQEGSCDAAELLLAHNAEVNSRSVDGSTPLYVAALENQKSVADILLRCGSHVNSCNNQNLTPLHCAAQEGSCDLAELLLSHNAQVNMGSVDGGTPLHLAALRNQTSVAHVLLRHGAHVNSCNNQNFTPLHAAALEGSCDVAELLLTHNAEVNGKSVDGSTPLHLAALKNKKSVADVLLRRGAYVNSCDNQDVTPLYCAAQEGSCDVAELLLSHNADVNMSGTCICITPLHVAAWHGHESVVQVLLKGGAEANARDVLGRTAVQLAGNRGHRDIVALLVSWIGGMGRRNSTNV